VTSAVMVLAVIPHVLLGRGVGNGREVSSGQEGPVPFGSLSPFRSADRALAERIRVMWSGDADDVQAATDP